MLGRSVWSGTTTAVAAGGRRAAHLVDSLRKGKNQGFFSQPTSNWYVCGPTVYDAAHIGHARTYLTLDIARRVCRDYFQRPVVLAMNVTDIDDKIIKRALATGGKGDSDVLDLARREERGFFEDMEALGVERPDVVARVTESVPCIQEMIQTLLDSGSAYISPVSNSVYFNLGPVSHAVDELPFVRGGGDEGEVEAEGEPGMQEKRNPKDFVLWKTTASSTSKEVVAASASLLPPATKVPYAPPADGEVTSTNVEYVGPIWRVPWDGGRGLGAGRPGWHIECSAMAMSIFGDTLDLHAGGIDLCFPHHANEITQCHAYSAAKDGREFAPALRKEGGEASCQGDSQLSSIAGAVLTDTGDREWCSHWMHIGHVMIKGRKMSKSLKNFISIKEALRETRDPDSLRLFSLLHHYSSPVIFQPDRVTDAEFHLRSLKRSLFLSDVLEATLSFSRGVNPTRVSPTLALSSPFLDPQAPKGEPEESPEEKLWRMNSELRSTLSRTQVEVHSALESNLNTPAAMKSLASLASALGGYVRGVPGSVVDSGFDDMGSVAARSSPAPAAARYLRRMHELFGCRNLDPGSVAAGFSDPSTLVNFSPVMMEGASSPTAVGGSLDSGLLDAALRFRSDVRLSSAGLQKAAKRLKKKLKKGPETLTASDVDELIGKCGEVCAATFAASDSFRDTALGFGIEVRDSNTTK